MAGSWESWKHWPPVDGLLLDPFQGPLYGPLPWTTPWTTFHGPPQIFLFINFLNLILDNSLLQRNPDDVINLKTMKALNFGHGYWKRQSLRPKFGMKMKFVNVNVNQTRVDLIKQIKSNDVIKL